MAHSNTPGTLAKFHLGLSADGTRCALVFVDEDRHSIACIAGPGDLERFIGSLSEAARQLARRRTAEGGQAAAGAPSTTVPGAIEVASSAFQRCEVDGSIIGYLIGDAGQVVGIRMKPHVAHEMTRNVLRSAQPAGLS